MKNARAIPAPRQEDDSRIGILGVVLWHDRSTLYAVVESDAAEIADGAQEEEQFDMFQMTDDLGNEYDNHGAGGRLDREFHVNEHQVRFHPGVAVDATKLTVTIWVRREKCGTVEFLL
jgi:hypothetical protein